MFGVSNISFSVKTKENLFLIFAIFVIASLFALGVWQINRMKWKNELITKIEKLGDTAPMLINEFSNHSKQDLIFQKIIISGTFVPNFNLYRYYYQNNKAFYEVFNILKLPSNQKLLVQRDFATEKLDFKQLKESKNTIKAIVLKAPKKGIFALSNNFINNLIFNINLAEINKHYSENLEEDIYLLQLNNVKDKQITKDILANIHNHHKLYAITWFSLCFIIIIMTFLKLKLIK